MMAFHGFEILPIEEGKNGWNHPALTTGDILQLQALFPDNPIWKARRGKGENFFHPTRGEALSLYSAMALYLERNTPSSAPYIGSLMGGASSNLKSVFDDLMPFLERELGIAVTVSA